MLGWLSQLLTPKRTPKRADPQRARIEAARVASTRKIAASYDAAATNDDNRKHWANADALSAVGANTESVRKTIRERARYETANNSYLKGIVSTLSTTLVGKAGPRLQATTGDPELNKAIEAAWSIWSAEIRLASKLRTLKTAKTVDGEAFGVFRSNDALRTSVKLDLSLVEADQVTTPDIRYWNNPYAIDGMRLDDYGNVVEYHVLKYHPGDAWNGFSLEYDRLPADRVVQWFRTDRPGQLRGISELSPALHLFGQMRRFTLATLTAAETAAMFAAVLKTISSGNADEGDAPEYWSTQEIVKGMMTVMPDGYDLTQFRAEHPLTTMEMFIKLLLREACRCLCLPWNIAAGDSSSFNFSSARLDHLIFRDSVEVERVDCEREVLDPLFSEWLEEASRIPKLLPQSIQAFLAGVPHKWHWPAWAILDPTTEASANTERLTNGTATLADVCGEQGKDWQEVIRQQEMEKAYRAKLQKELGTGEQAEAPKPEAKPVAASSLTGCGGEGGKPGPCPTGNADAPTGRKTPSKVEVEKIASIGMSLDKPDSPKLNTPQAVAADKAIRNAIGDQAVVTYPGKGFTQIGNDDFMAVVSVRDKGGKGEVGTYIPVLTPKNENGHWQVGQTGMTGGQAYRLPSDASPEDIALAVRANLPSKDGKRQITRQEAERLKELTNKVRETRKARKAAAPVQGSADIDACGGKGGKPGPCPTGENKPAPKGRAPAKAKPASKPKKPADVKVKAASDKVAKINAKVTKAKEKLATLKTELKAAKADLAAVKAGTKNKVAANVKKRAEIKPEVAEKSKDLYERAGKPGAISFEEIDTHISNIGTLRRGELAEVAKRVDVTVSSRDTKKSILEQISRSYKGRMENAERTGRNR